MEIQLGGNNLNQYGLNEFIKNQMVPDNQYGRIIKDYGFSYVVTYKSQSIPASTSGKLMNQSTERPVIGDWVQITLEDQGEKAIIHAVLQRKTEFSRKIAGNTSEKQVQGANFDVVFIVMSLNKDFNIRKLERFVLTAWDTGALPVVILTKMDLCPDADVLIRQAQAVAPGVEIIGVSSLYNQGLEQLTQFMGPGQTIALFGASGVGKSTLINTLAGKEVMKVNQVREDDDRGRHTTTHRELILLDSGVLFMDTPGMRELGIWDEGSGLEQAFIDVVNLEKDCRFNNCTHNQEPGCAINGSIGDGLLEQSRYDAYVKLKKEAAFVKAKADQRARLDQKNKQKELGKFIRNRNKIIY